MASNPSFLHSHYLKGKVLAALLALAPLLALALLAVSACTPDEAAEPLILLKQAATISLAGTGNIAILCAELDTLEMGLGAGVVSRPTGCL